MNCLELRRAKLADPRRLPPEAQAHLAACAACAAFAREVDESEQDLERALSVGVPDGLADRLVFHSLRPRRAWRAWALAASIAVAAALGFLVAALMQKPDDTYARLAIEHVVMEPESLTTTRNADPQAFRKVVEEFGAQLAALPGEVRYVRLCPVGDGMGWHVVFETPQGLVTLLLVPGQKLPGVETASAVNLSALARPVRGGYYAVITASASATAVFDKALRESILWG